MIDVQLIALDLRAERLAGSEDMLLAGEIIQGLGTHPVGQGAFAVVFRLGSEIPERTGIEKAQAPTASRTRCMRAS